MLRLFRQPPSRPALRLVYRRSRLYSSASKVEGLGILFCGSDAISVASLRALYDEHQQNPYLIRSIDVVCKTPKRIGRGLKIIREVPLASVARELSLPLHEIDTFTGWQPPKPQGLPINLVVAVSFGLKVPPRIIDAAKYGGLNMHPSMLPDFRGSAPLHHTLISGTRMTGVSLQTLHPTKFDHGTVLAQTPHPGIEHGASTVPQLVDSLAPMGADMLVQGIRDQIYVRPHKDVARPTNAEERGHLRLAAKIRSEDRHIQWHSWDAEEIMRRHRIIGPLWNFATCKTDEGDKTKRIIWTSGFRPVSEHIGFNSRVGRPIMIGLRSKTQGVYVKTRDSHILEANEAKVEGSSTSSASRAAMREKMIDTAMAKSNGTCDVGVFHTDLS